MKIIDEINFGNGLPEMRTWKQAEDAGKAVGFKLVTRSVSDWRGLVGVSCLVLWKGGGERTRERGECGRVESGVPLVANLLPAHNTSHILTHKLTHLPAPLVCFRCFPPHPTLTPTTSLDLATSSKVAGGWYGRLEELAWQNEVCMRGRRGGGRRGVQRQAYGQDRSRGDIVFCLVCCA